MRRVYFAYGSNLDIAQMRLRCPGAMVVGAAILPDHELAFTGISHSWAGGVATVRPSPAADVPGALYALGGADWKALDRYEGAPRLYVRAGRRVRTAEGRELTATVYVRSRDEALSVPSPLYLGAIKRGYADFGLPDGVLTAALERARVHGRDDEL